MKSIEIVTHVFAGKLPLYAQHLRFQLASLLHHPPEARVVYVLYWAGPEHDEHTAEVAADFYDALIQYQALSRVSFRSEILPKEQLFRRAIGRHQRTQRTECDVLWLADADMTMNEGAIDSVCEQVQDDGRLYFPRRSLMSIDHATGQQTLEAAANTMWPQIDPAQYKPQRNFYAIGGIQILGRETAKKTGYLGFGKRHAKWMQPVDPEKPFAEFRDDTAWRRSFFAGEKQVKIDVPNLYRLRHEFSSLRPDGFPKEAAQ